MGMPDFIVVAHKCRAGDSCFFSRVQKCGSRSCCHMMKLPATSITWGPTLYPGLPFAKNPSHLSSVVSSTIMTPYPYPYPSPSLSL